MAVFAFDQQSANPSVWTLNSFAFPRSDSPRLKPLAAGHRDEWATRLPIGRPELANLQLAVVGTSIVLANFSVGCSFGVPYARLGSGSIFSRVMLTGCAISQFDMGDEEQALGCFFF